MRQGIVGGWKKTPYVQQEAVAAVLLLLIKAVFRNYAYSIKIHSSFGLLDGKRSHSFVSSRECKIFRPGSKFVSAQEYKTENILSKQVVSQCHPSDEVGM